MEVWDWKVQKKPFFSSISACLMLSDWRVGHAAGCDFCLIQGAQEEFHEGSKNPDVESGVFSPIGFSRSVPSSSIIIAGGNKIQEVETTWIYLDVCKTYTA